MNKLTETQIFAMEIFLEAYLEDYSFNEIIDDLEKSEFIYCTPADSFKELTGECIATEIICLESRLRDFIDDAVINAIFPSIQSKDLDERKAIEMKEIDVWRHMVKEEIKRRTTVK